MNDIDKYPNKISILLKQGKSTIDQWKNEKELSLLINNCINIEKNLMKINNIEQNLKKSKGAMSSEIKFSPSEYEFEDFISILTTFGKIFKEKKGENEENKNNLEQNIFEQNIFDQNIFDIEIKTTNEELNELSIELSNFSQKEYNIYYSNDINYKENEIVLTFHFGIEDGYIKEIIENEKLFKKLSKKFNEPFSLRKKENKLFLDFNINLEEIEKVATLLFFYYLHKFIFNLCSVSIKFKNNLTFEKFVNMDSDEFYRILSSFVFNLKGNFKNLENSFASFKQQKLKGPKDMHDVINKIMITLMTNKNMKFKFDASKEKIFDFIKLFSEKKLNSCLSFIKGMIKIGIDIPKQMFFYTFEKELNYNKIFITLLDSKLKSGFALKINSKGINNFMKEFKY